MFSSLFLQFEDPNRPFLGPILKYLSFWGLWLPDGFRNKCFAILIQLLETIFITTEFLDIFYVKTDLNLVLTNLKFSMQGVINICKAWSLIFWQKDWRNVCEYVTRADLENRRSKDPQQEEVVRKFTRYSRKVTYMFCALSYATAFVVIFQPAFKYLLSPKYRENTKDGTEDYMEVVSSWVPFDKHKMPGYFFACVIQAFGTLLACAWITSYDMIALSVMIFIRLELESIRIDCATIFDENDGDIVLDRIKRCHRRHVELIRCCRLYNSCSSPILMLYTFICTVMLCATAHQINMETNKMQQMMTLIYLIFGISQLFLYCWHSNDVYYASMALATGPYESKWWSQNASKQRSIYILVGQLSKLIIFTAGPFTNLTVATFINILRGAYSYYTLL
ncbi:odorant receptor 49b-like [Colias croceus]|uniref:odorant receptor 49b-like n=1 Tax=Colias crocea TaxID=72248 RepID=UPI001E27AEFF|nr:odorant receptor 49b-like [Colias croceus]